MLLFIDSGQCSHGSQNRVSIHLMLLFIKILHTKITANRSFNTSHVTLYLQTGFGIQQAINAFQYISCYSLSATPVENIVLYYVFQYISCYSLSFIFSWIHLAPTKFQYISCYSLSAVCSLAELMYQMFQYISCYSLSGSSWAGHHQSTFQYISCYSLSL